MRKANTYAFAVVGIFAVAGLLLVALLLTQRTGQTSQARAGLAVSATGPAPSSPLLPTVAPTAAPAEEPFQGEANIKSSAMTPVSLTPEPWIPPTPYPEDTVTGDSAKTFRVMVPKGWYASFPDNLLQGEATIANFDLGAMEGRPEGGISVNFGIGELEPEQTFEQWLAARRQLEAHPDYGSPPRPISDSQPITLAGYSGVTDVMSVAMDNGEWWPVQNIYLAVDEKWVMGVVIKPTSAPDYQKAVAVLQSMNITLH